MSAFVPDSAALEAVYEATVAVGLGSDPLPYADLFSRAASALPYGYLHNRRRKHNAYCPAQIERGQCECGADLAALQLPYTDPGSICPECNRADLRRPAAALRCPVCEAGYLHSAPATIRAPIVARHVDILYSGRDGQAGSDLEYENRDYSTELMTGARHSQRGHDADLQGDGQDERALSCDSCPALLYLSFVPALHPAPGCHAVPAVRDCHREWESVNLAGGDLHTDIHTGAVCPILYPVPAALQDRISPDLIDPTPRPYRFDATDYLTAPATLLEAPAECDLGGCPDYPLSLVESAALILRTALQDAGVRYGSIDDLIDPYGLHSDLEAASV